MSRRFCRVETDGSLTVVTIDRPEVLNALHEDAHFELAAVFDAFAMDPRQQVAVLTGAGERAFCAGNDLKYQLRTGSMRRPASGFGGLTSRFDLDKPVIAVVNGVAMGGGFELALACDLILAAEHAEFALPEPRVGRAALGGGLQRLPRQIGLKQAMGIVLTGRRVGAAEGQRLGFVNEVVPAGELMQAARRWAGWILECSPGAVQASKQAVLRGLQEATVSRALEAQPEYPAVRAMLDSPDYEEGTRAFAEKRRPVWRA